MMPPKASPSCVLWGQRQAPQPQSGGRGGGCGLPPPAIWQSQGRKFNCIRCLRGGGGQPAADMWHRDGKSSGEPQPAPAAARAAMGPSSAAAVLALLWARNLQKSAFFPPRYLYIIIRD